MHWKKRTEGSTQIRESKSQVSNVAQQVQTPEYEPNNPTSISVSHKLAKSDLLFTVETQYTSYDKQALTVIIHIHTTH